MATIKSYTDLEQSKKLAKILPLESADMYYHPYPNDEDWYDIPNFGEADLKFNQLPCWSLAALLSVLPSVTIDCSADHYFRVHYVKNFTEWYDNAIDACYEMIVKLNELKL